ncbi:MAG TPA: SLBB domain-containing protein [Burkholderiaceae bacterium]|nr:SLBB domain-containing protein [Burkholderiaceae bacterium]
MSALRSRPARRRLALWFSLCLAAAPLAAQTTDNPNDPTNTFSTPGYPANTPRSGLPAGTTTGQPNTQGLTNSQGYRSPQIQNGTNNNVRGNANNLNPYDEFNRRALLPPPKPSEFQKFVETATGRLLPLFGSRFFADTLDPYTTVDNVPVSADYTIGPGDEIVLRAWGSIDVDYRSTVDRNGLLNLPKIGSFNVAGVKAADLEKNLRGQIGRLYTNFDLSVSLGQLRGLKVFVVGPAQRPGVFTLASQSTLLSAVAMAGGPAPSGSMRKVLLRRDGKVISELDVYEFLVQGDKSKDVQLAAGDVVVFQPAGARVALTGALDTPAIYELKAPQEPVREVLRYAGGTPLLANPNLAQLERVDTTQAKAARFVEKFQLDGTGLQKPLRDGDVLTLLAISPQFANAVTLRGHVAQPLRYPFTPGMRIRDLIPDRDALISPDFYRRKNLLVQVIDEDDETTRRRSERYRESRDLNTGGPTNAYPTGAYGANNANNGYPANANNSANNAYPPSGDYRNRSNYDPGYGPDTNDTGASMQRNRSIDPSQRRSDDSRRDDDRSGTSTQRRTPRPLFDELNWDYAVVERLNTRDLTTQVIPFNLGKAVLQGSDVDNLELLPGDVVTIYSQKDIRVSVSRQTRLVSLEGEIASPGVYQLQPGDTLQSLIARAGGFTPQAYLYGLEFSREETRQRQRENLTSAIARLEALSAVQAARDAANRRDDAAGAATSTAVSNAATQAQLARLRNVQPNGRIALELPPDTNSLAALPPVPLEAGDRILVPSRPGFVTVAGAVVNSNAFLWKPGRTAGEYLRMAGADEAAEPSNMFILRADGTVNHAADNRSFWGRSSLDSQVMQPGDALIVPNQLDFETWGRAFVRNLKDFAQIFTGFGIGIAAIHSL